jgi:hypothetical protein
MKKIFFLSLTLVFLFVSQLVNAQGCESSSPSEGEDEGGIKVFGFIQPQFKYELTDPATNTFSFKRARIGVTGDIPYDFSYYVVMENSAFVSQSGYPYLLDAYVSYKRFKWLNISFGSFKQPFGQEVNTACSGLHTIERSMVSDQIASPQRDMGIMFLGGDNTTKVKYAFAIMNGRGLGVKDNNTAKDFIGRITFKPLEFLRIGGSFRYGFPNVSDVERTSFAGELEINKSNILLQAEYIYDEGDYNRAAGGGCGADPLTLGEKRDGAYVMLGYMTPFMLQPIVKYDYFDTDKSIDDNTMSVITFGANYFFNDNTRLQVNYQYKAEQGAEVMNDAIGLQLQIKF